MKRTILGLVAGLFAAVAVASTAYAMDPAKYADSSLGKILVGPKGMTLYTWANDTMGETASACTGKCISAWPPLVAPADAKAMGDWTTVNVTDKGGKAEKMWAYKGQPLYYFIKDKKPGDVTGEGSMGFGAAWHVVKEAM
jgi:predicted lipoprotein with Yx(FWY)xxD motif